MSELVLLSSEIRPTAHSGAYPIVHRTGSPLLNDLAAVHDGIMERMRSRRQALPARAASSPPVPIFIFPSLPRPNLKSLEERIAEADALSDKLPYYSVKKIKDCIYRSAAELGETWISCECQPRIAVRGKPTIVEIQKVVARHFNMSLEILLSRRRYRGISRSRQIAMYLSRLLTPRSLNEIGRHFDLRDHSTVLHAARKIAALVEQDKALAEEIAVLRGILLP